MKTWSVSSRRPLATLAAPALCAALALAISVTGAAADKGGKCVKGAEAPGCSLPPETIFQKNLPHNGSVKVSVNTKGGISFTAYAAPIKCTKYTPTLGSEQQLALSLSDNRKPKVGKTYLLKKTENRTEVEEGEQPERGLFEAKIQFKSATQVIVTFHLLDEVGTEVSCDGSATWTLKRQG
jgi:hypothetical protein